MDTNMIELEVKELLGDEYDKFILPKDPEKNFFDKLQGMRKIGEGCYVKTMAITSDNFGKVKYKCMQY
jgi:hypothetical protein|tara:strand:- start:775 stop:978 length:204 start_codon:yes stop_codon:yes gene_type:complete